MKQLKLHIQRMRELGLTDVDESRIAAHSLRRTGANAFRDACRAQGMPEPMIRIALKEWGRWSADESVDVYVFEGNTTGAAVMAGEYGGTMRGGRTVRDF